MKALSGGALVGALVLLSTDAAAQVNTEVLRKRIKLKGISFVLEGTFDGHTGNTTGLTADGLIGGGLRSGRHMAFAFASADYSKLNGTLGIDKSFAHVRYNLELAPWAWWEVFAQTQSDYFQLLEIRNLFGTGPRFAASRTGTSGSSSASRTCWRRTRTTWPPGPLRIARPSTAGSAATCRLTRRSATASRQ